MNYHRVDPSEDYQENAQNTDSPKSSFHTPSPRSSTEFRHETSGKPNCSSTLTPPVISSNAESGIPRKTSRVFVDEFTRSRLKVLENRRTKWKYLSIIWTACILLATVWMAVEDTVSFVNISRAVSYDYDRACLALAYLILRILCALVACLILLWLSFFQRLSKLYTALLLACTFTSFLQVALAVINVVLAYCWQSDSYPARSILHRCDWTIDVVWRWGPAGKTCDNVDSVSAWQIAAWLRLLFSIIILTTWIVCLSLFARSLIALNIIRDSYDCNVDETKSLMGSRSRVTVHLPEQKTQASSPITPYTGHTSSISSKMGKKHAQALLGIGTHSQLSHEENKSPVTSVWDPIDWVFGLDEADVVHNVVETGHLLKQNNNPYHQSQRQSISNSGHASESPFSRNRSLESQEQEDPLWSLVTPAAAPNQQHSSLGSPTFTPLALDDPFLAVHESQNSQSDMINKSKDPAMQNAVVIPLSKPRKPLPIPPIQPNNISSSTVRNRAKSANSLALSISTSSSPTIKSDRVAEWAASQSPMRNMTVPNRKSADSTNTIKLPEIIKTDMDGVKEVHDDKDKANNAQIGTVTAGEEEDTDYTSAAEFGLSSATGTGQSSTTSTKSSTDGALTTGSVSNSRLSPRKSSKDTNATSEDLPLSASVRSVRTNGTDSPTLGRELRVDEIGQLHHQLRLLERDPVRESWRREADKVDPPELAEKAELGRASVVQLSYPTPTIQTLPYDDNAPLGSSFNSDSVGISTASNAKKGYIASQPMMGDRYTHQPGMSHRSDSVRSGRVVYVRMSDGKLVRKLSTIRSEGSDRGSSLSNLSARSFGIL